MVRCGFVILAISIAQHAEAELLYTGPSVFEAHSNTIRLDNSPPQIDATIAGSTGVFTTRDLVSHQVVAGATSGIFDPRVFFGLKTGSDKVVLSNLRTSFIGTATYTGGGTNTDYTVSLTGETSLWRHEDLNGNGLLEGPEPLFEIGKWPGSLGTITTVGDINYNSEFGAGSTRIELDADSSYVLLQDFFVSFSGTGSLTDPPVILSANWSLPQSRHQTQFDFQVVPEPNSSALLVIATLLAIWLKRH